MGLFSKAKKTTNLKSNVPGRSCFDCKHCDVNRVQGETVYCRWDDTYYCPETGLNCIDFNK